MKITLAHYRILMYGAGITGATLLLYRAISRYVYWHGEFKYAGKVGALYLYPVKSLKGKKVPEMNCTLRGGRYASNVDRDFVIIDECRDNKYLPATNFPNLILLESNVDEHNILKITSPGINKDEGGECVYVNLKDVTERNDIRRAKMYNNAETDGLDCGDEVGKFLTRVLNFADERQLRMLYFSDGLFTERDSESDPWCWMNPVPKIRDHVAFAYLGSYMAFTLASVDDLNERLEAKGESTLDERNFRPNIVVTENSVPFDEDRWLHLRIGNEVEFVCYRPCTRCILTTVNPDTGKRHQNLEPLKELRSYRLAPTEIQSKVEEFRASPVLGVYMTLSRAGRIKVGDDVFVRYKPTPY